MFPLIYSPELIGGPGQFSSEVADMKNSVKDRTNASSSGAGHFIEDHLCGDKWAVGKTGADQGLWAHCDIAYPAFQGDRGTGYGVALLLDVLESIEK